MRRSLVLAFLPLLMGLAPAQQPLPVRYAFGNMCGFTVAPPKTLAEWRDRADLVIHVRVESQSFFEDHAHPHFTDLWTAHEVAVLTLIKGHPRAVAEGAVQQILQRGGRIERTDHILVETWNGFDMMPIGSEWLLFLEWNPRLNGFTLFYREHGAIQIKDGQVATADTYHRVWNGRPAEELMEALASLRIMRP